MDSTELFSLCSIMPLSVNLDTLKSCSKVAPDLMIS